MPEPQKIKLLVVDDHPLIREGIKAHLETCERIEVIGAAANGQEALRLTRELAPDVALVDISLPDINGFETSQLLRQAVPQIKIIILTIHDNEEYVAQAFQVGAHGYVVKDTPADELIKGIELVCQGQMFVSSAVAHDVVQGYIKQVQEKRALSPREPGEDRAESPLEHPPGGFP